MAGRAQIEAGINQRYVVEVLTTYRVREVYLVDAASATEAAVKWRSHEGPDRTVREQPSTRVDADLATAGEIAAAGVAA